MNKPLLCIAISGMFLLTSCASVFHGSKSKVTFNGEPGAEIYVNNNYMGVTPSTIKIRNTEFKKGNLIVVKKDGKEQQLSMKRRVMAGYLIADIVLGGLIFTGIDFLTGAIYNGSPDEINYKAGSQPSANSQ